MVEKVGFTEAFAQQAANLHVTESSVREALRSAPPAPWAATETVGIVAMGASSHAGSGLAAALVRAGARAVNLTASDLDLAPDGYQPADHYVVVSESGRSPEPLRAARGLTPGRRIAVTNDPSAPLTEHVDLVLPMGGWPDSRVYTSGFTATLLAFAALLEHQGLAVPGDTAADLPDLVGWAAKELADDAARAARLLADVHAVDVVGRGVSMAAANEGALVLREGARLHAAAYDTYQYIHGPMEPLRAGSGLVVLGSDRELPMLDMVLDRDVRAVLLTTEDAPVVRPEHPNLVTVRIPSRVTGFGRAAVETVFVQMLTLAYCQDAGIDIDEFLYDQPDTKLTDEQVQTPVA
jgi:fructoselysine-6-P-deglycase FrlB-like protein